ncbi:hypothetical protein V9L05_08670 [Bernardetia sp. Wsw4-3y2]|uniref:hypothetical protein n=1 Tax=Bernardetia sp. Wsw4-3y2 TaxID=3127471 RepID=UPI0030CF21C2
MRFTPIQQETGLQGGIIDISDVCLTKDCRERKQETEILKQQILANALQTTANSFIDDTSNTLKTVQYVAIAIGGAATIGILYYAFRPIPNTTKSKSKRTR